VIGILITLWQNKQIQRLLPILLSLIGCLSSAIGLYQGYMLMQAFRLPTNVGLGGVITTACLGLAACLYITKQSSQTTLFAMKTYSDRAV